jgi:hypothetical protein
LPRKPSLLRRRRQLLISAWADNHSQFPPVPVRAGLKLLVGPGYGIPPATRVTACSTGSVMRYCSGCTWSAASSVVHAPGNRPVFAESTRRYKFWPATPHGFTARGRRDRRRTANTLLAVIASRETVARASMSLMTMNPAFPQTLDPSAPPRIPVEWFELTCLPCGEVAGYVEKPAHRTARLPARNLPGTRPAHLRPLRRPAPVRRARRRHVSRQHRLTA